MSVTFDSRLKKKQRDQLWREYCGFLDLSIEEYMAIQERLLLEQLELYSRCGLGERFFRGGVPRSMEEFRNTVPLTTYDDYADVLLNKRADMLPSRPMVWIQTTWESGKHPIKLAPYTESMMDTYRRNLEACMILATSDKKGSFSINSHDRILYGLAPLPYATGLFPHVIKGDLTLDFLPPVEEAARMGFGQSSREGFRMGLEKGIDLFFGMSSVIARISEKFSLDGGGGADLLKFSPKMLLRILRARQRCRTEKRKPLPRDVFTLKGFVCSGTDSRCYKDRIEQYWGIRPLEVAGGTESTCIGTETWNKDGLVFFPDACFYEFIPEAEMLRGMEDPSYQPRTYLMNELREGEIYEIVLTLLKGGAFLRYRLGDMYRCLRRKNERVGLDLPQLEYLDRVPGVIDIAGFTRISEETICEAIRLSKLELGRWIALKEYDEERRPYLHMYLEVPPQSVLSGAATQQVIMEHLSVYFRYVDHDYQDLRKMLGIDPLVVDILPFGTIEAFEASHGRRLRAINPSGYDVIEMLRPVRPGSFL